MVLVIDNYDSFTFNLVQMLRAEGVEVRVRRNDEIDVNGIRASGASHVVVSPGPGSPDRAGVSVEAVRRADVPVLGVCLGHQALAVAFGGRVVRAPRPVHGFETRVGHVGTGLFAGVPQGFVAARYHSLVVDRSTLPAELHITATNEDDLIMALQHRERPIAGVQFHPESVLTTEGVRLIRNFLECS